MAQQNQLGSLATSTRPGLHGNANMIVVDIDGMMTYLDPRMTPLLWLLEKIKSGDPDNQKFEWPERTRVGWSTTVSITANWSAVTEHVGYASFTVADASIFIPTGLVYFPKTETVARVTASDPSAGTVTLYLGPGGASAVNEVSNGDTIINLGTVQEEGSAATRMQSGITSLKDNYVHIHRRDFSITESAKKVKTYTGNEWLRVLGEQMQLYAEEWERIMLFSKKGIQLTGTHPKRWTSGLFEQITTNVVARNYDNYNYDQFLKDDFQMKEYESGMRLNLCGQGWLTRINQSGFFPENSRITLDPAKETSFGMMYQMLRSPWGTTQYVVHPLFARTPVLENVAVSLVPDLLSREVWRPAKTILIPGNADTDDDTKGYMIAEQGLKVRKEQAAGYIVLAN